MTTMLKETMFLDSFQLEIIGMQKELRHITHMGEDQTITFCSIMDLLYSTMNGTGDPQPCHLLFKRLFLSDV